MMVSATITGHAPAPVALPGFAAFGAVLAMAGLPIYIHAPKFYVDSYGVSLTALGGVLFALRLIDFLQDPALGWLAARLRARRGAAAAGAGALMATGMLGLFAVPPPVAPLLWFALMLVVLFSAFSFLTIAFYATGARAGEALGQGGHVRLAGWRETGALAGVCLAAAAPSVLVLFSDRPFALFALGFAVLVALALLLMRGQWHGPQGQAAARMKVAQPGFATVLRDRIARRLLLVAILNATPVAITSTLFLFFVESRLQAPGWEGPLLMLFFLAAALSAPGWARAAQRLGARRTLLAGMALAVLAFGCVPLLGPGDIAGFALICLVSGAGLGADLTLLSALFSRRMARITPEAGHGFGLWAFCSKATLAIAAIALLPALDRVGFVPGPTNTDAALQALVLMYAALPCVLKLMAMTVLATTPLEEV